MSTIGPHLLGRIAPTGVDERDYPLSTFLAGGTPLEAALAAMNKSWMNSPSLKKWAKLVTAAIEVVPTPVPTPTPTPDPVPVPVPVPTPSGDVLWVDSDLVLDQGDTGHCVGFGGADWGNTLPVDDHFANADGHSIYYECTVIDGDPNNENGSTVHSLAKALKNRGRLTTYAWDDNIENVIAWLRGHGPVIFGTDWYDGMFNPDANAFIAPTGSFAGGHCYVAIGVTANDDIVFLNSWGAAWGNNGRFLMTKDDSQALLHASGEALAAVELS